MKKLLSILFLGMFLISFASAFEFDNVKDYDEETKEITFKNSLLRIPTTTIAKTRLIENTCNGLQDCYSIINMSLYEDYNNPIRDIGLKRLTNGGWYDIGDYSFKLYKHVGEKNIYKPTYEKICSKSEKDSWGNDACEWIQNGTTTIQEPIWEEIKEIEITKGEYIIKLSLTKGIYDTVDWYGTFFGTELTEWAVFDNAIGGYWNFDTNSPSSTTFNQDNITINNFTEYTGSPVRVAGKVGPFQMDFTKADSDSLGNTTYDWSGITEFSYSFWMNVTDNSTEQGIIAGNWTIGGSQFTGNEIAILSSGNLQLTIGDGSSNFVVGSKNIFSNTSHFIVFTAKEGDQLEIYVDNNNIANTSFAGTFGLKANASTTIGGRYILNDIFYDGTLDEVGFFAVKLTPTDVNELYNGGAGLPFGAGSPTITLNTPEDNAFFNASPIGISFNATLEDDVNITNASLYIDNAVNFSFNPSVNRSELFVNVTLENGVHNWSVVAIDNLGLETNSTLRTFTIDAILPEISITYPTNGTEILTLEDAINVTFNVSVSDNTGLGTCFFFNSTANITLTCPNNASVVLGGGFHTLIYYANDTAGNLQQNSTTIFINNLNETWFFIDPIIENTMQSINFILAGTNITAFNGTIFYNNTEFTPSISFNDTAGNLTIELNSTSISSVTNITMFANYSVNDVNFTSQEINQTVLFLDIDDCSAFNNTILNFTVVDEKNQTFISGATIEVAVNIFDNTRTNLILNVSDTYGNPAEICLNINLTSSTTYSLDSVIRYEKILAYANEYYNIVNFNLTNNSATQDIVLFDLNLSDSTPFKIVFTDQFLAPLADVLVFIERQYISEDTFKVVELPITDSNGETIGHFVRNEVLYNLKFVKSGVLLVEFLNIRTFCEDFSIDDCQLILSSTGITSLPPTYDSLFGVTFSSPSFNSTTGVVRFDFTSVDGTAKNIVMNVSRNDVFGNRTICSDSLTASSGTLVCSTGNITDTLLIVDVLSENSPILKSSLEISSGGGFGNVGYIVWFVFTLVYVLMLGQTKSGVLIGLGVSFIGVVAMFITEGAIVGVASGGIWILVIILAGIWKLNKERPQ